MPEDYYLALAGFTVTLISRQSVLYGGQREIKPSFYDYPGNRSKRMHSDR
jgi:hypothetical protein